MKRLAAVLVVAALAAAPALAQEHSMSAPHKVFTADNLQWMPGPAKLPAGAQIAVLKGDPAQEGFFVLRVRLPTGLRVMPHWHPAAENVTVISGSLGLGAGEAFDKAKGQVLGPGSFVSIPPTHRHFAWAESDVVLQLNGIGPFQIYYVNPADDPSTTASQVTK